MRALFLALVLSVFACAAPQSLHAGEALARHHCHITLSFVGWWTDQEKVIVRQAARNVEAAVPWHESYSINIVRTTDPWGEQDGVIGLWDEEHSTVFLWMERVERYHASLLSLGMHELGHSAGARHICRSIVLDVMNYMANDCSPVGMGPSVMNPAPVITRWSPLDLAEFRRHRHSA